MKYLIVGLGNPGEKYRNTRHNVGWLLLDNAFGEDGWGKSRGTQALYKKVDVEGEEVEILKPTSFMNKSGSPVEYARNKHDVLVKDIIVIHDDIHLPLGVVKISFGKGAGGHNGVSSLIQHLGSSDFVRIRVGVAPVHFSTRFERKFSALGTYVLGRFSKKEEEVLDGCAQKVISIIRTVIEKGVEKTMTEFN